MFGNNNDDGFETNETQNLVKARRAFRHTPAVERANGKSVVGAIKIDAAPMAMADEDDLGPHVMAFAAALSNLPKCRGMLLDAPESLQSTGQGMRRVERHKEYAERQRGMAEGDDLSASERWAALTRADVADEIASVESLYRRTTNGRAHYIVLQVTEDDVVYSTKDDDGRVYREERGGIHSIPGLGDWLRKRQAKSMRGDTEDQKRLVRRMVQTLNKRLDSLAQDMGMVEGISARPISSEQLTTVAANHYRGDDVFEIEEFNALVRMSPVPEDTDPDPEYRDGKYHYPDAGEAANGEDEEERERVASSIEDGLSKHLDDDERAYQYRTLLSPKPFGTEDDRGALTLDNERRVKTIRVDGWPEVPSMAFLEALYRYDKPGIDVTIATHFNKRDDGKVRRQAKQQENTLRNKLESGLMADFLDAYYERRYEEAKKFVQNIEWSDYGLFDVGLTISVSAPAVSLREYPDGTEEIVRSDDALNDAVDDIKEILREDCGLSAAVLEHLHEDGWQATAPLCNNPLGENVTLFADGLARQFPYQYRAHDDGQGAMVGVHQYLDEPQFFDPFVGENGHDFGVYGMKGSGKTTFLQRLATQLKHDYESRGDNLAVALSSPFKDMASLAELYGGQHVEIGVDSAVNPWAVYYVSPEDMGSVDDNEPWTSMLDRADAFLGTYYDDEGLSDYSDKRDTWMLAGKEAHKKKGLDPDDPSTYDAPNPTQDEVIDELRRMVHHPEEYVDTTPVGDNGETLADDDKSLEKRADTAREILNNDVGAFGEDGKYQHFLDETTIDLSENDFVFIDYSKYEGNTKAGGLLMLMVNWILYEQAKGYDGNVLLGNDEFHYWMRNPRSKEFAQRIARHGRHFDISLGVATQEFGDMFSTAEDGSLTLSGVASDILTEQRAQFYLYTREMTPEWAELLELSERSYDFIKDADTGSHERGSAQALMSIDGTAFPLRIEMDDDLNPRQFSLYEHDAAKHPPLVDFLRGYTDSEGLDVCDWSWLNDPRVDLTMDDLTGGAVRADGGGE